jgi:tetratricopeptide (TPR) repeat protein
LFLAALSGTGLAVRMRPIDRWLVAGIVVVVCASFAPALVNDFVNWDDDLVLTDNTAYRGLSPSHLRWMVTTTHGGHWQPLTWLSYAVDHALWGMDPRGYHVTNVLLHALNAVLVWSILRALLAGRGPEGVIAAAAAVGALFFGIHPLRVESVAWATERRDVLSGCFWLLAIAAYLRAVARPGHPRFGPALAALALSLTAKAWGMTFPLVLLVLDAWPLDRLRRDPRTVVAEKIPFAALAAIAAGLAFQAQRAVPEMRSFADHGVAARVAQAAYGLCHYLVTTVLPVGLSPAVLLAPDFDPFSPRHLIALGIVVTITGASIRLRRRAPWLLATWTAYVVIVAPVLGLAQTGPQLVADRYTYLAMLPWAALLAAALVALWSSPAALAIARAAAAAAAIVLATYGALTFRQTRVWHDSLTLWNHALAIDPDNWVAYTNRGFARRATDPEAALADYSAAIARNPRWYLPFFNRGNLRQERGDLAGAVADHTRVLELLPDDPRGWTNRGWARQAQEDWKGAIADYERALDVAPPDWWARDMVLGNLATARARMTASDR